MIRIHSLDNPLIKHLSKLRTDANYRRVQNKVVLAGKSLIHDYSKRVKLRVLLLAEDLPIEQFPSEHIVITTRAILKKITGVETPDGYAAEVNMPQESSLEGCRMVIAFDGVSDPGNLGTLLRSALAFGWDGAFLLPGTCDPFNDKALRAARGAQLWVPLRRGNLEELKELCTKNQLTALAADIQGSPIDDFTNASPKLLVVGNEARGIDPALLKWCQPITIPMTSHMESLNVSIAGSILMFMLNNPSPDHG